MIGVPQKVFKMSVGVLPQKMNAEIQAYQPALIPQNLKLLRILLTIPRQLLNLRLLIPRHLLKM